MLFRWKSELLKKAAEIVPGVRMLTDALIGKDGITHPKGQEVYVLRKKDNPHRAVIKDPQTGAVISEAHAMDLHKMVH